ncbi:hypothetical protein [Streptomyces adonidis]|uniref:hypothetical protein n=1 Tax=Streptomyces adonidis TaxID=3231367 RepID=UPI0034DB1356
MNQHTTTGLIALVVLGTAITAITYDNQELAVSLGTGLGAVAVVLALLALLDK